MKKVRTIKISVTTREILIGGSVAPESSAESELSLCPACHSRIAEAVGSAVVALSETDVQNRRGIQIGNVENLIGEKGEIE